MSHIESTIAVTDAEVQDHEGRQIFQSPFLSVNVQHVELIAPDEMAVYGLREDGELYPTLAPSSPRRP